MTEVILPNQRLIRELFENYYCLDSTPDSLISSHWKYYSQKFNVQFDNEGNIISLRGIGFGDMLENSSISKILAYLCHASYFIKLPFKKDLYRMIVKSIHICDSMGLYFSFDCFKQVCSLSLIKRNLI